MFVLVMARTDRFGALAAVVLAAASFAPESIDAQRTAGEPPFTVEVGPGTGLAFALSAPDGTIVAAASCVEDCQVPDGWMHGPGRYTLRATSGSASREVALDVRGNERAFHAWLYESRREDGVGVEVRIGIERTDRRLVAHAHARVGVEIENGTDLDLSAWAQGRRVHWSMRPRDPRRTELELQRDSIDTAGFCPMGSYRVPVPARAWTRLPPLHRASLFGAHAGPYVGRVVLRVAGQDFTPVSESYVVTFDIAVVMDPRVRDGLVAVFSP